MILDAQCTFSDAQALTATALGTNVYDLGTALSLGNGEPMGVHFTVDVAADQTSGNEDYTFQVTYSSDAAQTTALIAVGAVAFESGTPTAPALDADLLVAGFQFVIPVPMTAQSMDGRYIGVRYLLAGTTPTITVSSYLGPLSLLSVAAPVYTSGFSIT